PDSCSTASPPSGPRCTARACAPTRSTSGPTPISPPGCWRWWGGAPDASVQDQRVADRDATGAHHLRIDAEAREVAEPRGLDAVVAGQGAEHLEIARQVTLRDGGHHAPRGGVGGGDGRAAEPGRSAALGV